MFRRISSAFSARPRFRRGAEFALGFLLAFSTLTHTASGQSDEEMQAMYGDGMSGDPAGYGYEGDEQYGGGQPSMGGRSMMGSGQNLSPQEQFQQQVGMAMGSFFQSPGMQALLSPDSKATVATGPVLRNESEIAFALGDAALARELLFGHIVAEFEDASEVLSQVRYSRLMKRPAWQVRWGVSFAVRGEATDPQPIEASSSGEFGGMGMGGMEGGMGMGRGGRGGPGGMGRGMGMDMDQGGGFDDGMESGMDPGSRMGMGMGAGLEGMGGDQSGGMMEGMDGGMMGGGMGDGLMMGGRSQGGRPTQPAATTPAARLAALDRSMLNEDADSELQRVVGLVATMLGEEFDARYEKAEFGGALTGLTAESGNRETVTGDFVDLLETSEPLPMWRPGLVYVGEGASSETTPRARGMGLDLLIHLDVLLKPRGEEFTQNISRIRLIHVPSGKSMGVSKSIDSLEFSQQNRSKQLDARDYVGDQLSNLWAIVDRDTLTMPMPQLTPEVAVRRIGSLLASGGGKNLRTLAEVRLFQSQRLLTEDQVLQAFDIVGGEEAVELLYAEKDDRLKIVREWATK